MDNKYKAILSTILLLIFGSSMISVVQGDVSHLGKLLFAHFGFVSISIVLLADTVNKKDSKDLTYFLVSNYVKGMLIIGFSIVILAPVLEEIIFRVIPSTISSFIGISGIGFGVICIISTGVWVYLHGERKLIIGVQGVEFAALMYHGLLFEAFIIHILNNLFVFILLAVGIWSVRRGSSYDGEPAPPDTPALPEPSFREQAEDVLFS